MILLLDTDVLVDLALDRKPHSAPAGRLLDLLAERAARGFVAWHTVANFYYLVAPTRGNDEARRFLVDLAEFVEVVPTTTEDLRFAARLPMADFEDALQVAAATACRAEVIATRNLRDFRRSPVRAAAPASLLGELSP